jgi:FtsZ-binding cell division protein ZapB
MEKSSSARRITGTEELLSVMSNEEMNTETKKSYKSRWQQIFMTCFCIFTIAAAAKGFLYLDTEVSTVQSAVGSAAKDLNTLKAEVTAADTKERLAAVTAEIEDLKATNTQLRAEAREIREAFETFKTRKDNVVPAQRKRR